MSLSPAEAAFRDAQRARLEKLRALLAEGETNPARIIARLDDESRVTGPNGHARMVAGRLTPPGKAFDFDDQTFYPKCPRMPTGVPSYAFSSLSRTRTLRPYYGDFDTLPIEMLLDAIEQGPTDAIAEIGGDFGQRLVQLYLRGAPRSIPYLSLEPSEVGRDGTELLRPRVPGMDLRAVALDLAAPDFSCLRDLGRVLIFSYGALTTATTLPTGLLATMAAAAPAARAFHFEAVGQQINRDDQNLAWYYDHAQAQGFNTDFVGQMMNSHAAGAITAQFLAADIYDLSFGIPMSLGIWKGKSAA